MSKQIRRRSLRLPDYDYTDPGAYFVTIGTHNRVFSFGRVVAGEMQLNATGELVQAEWLQTPTLRPQVSLDMHVVMPNHFHAILILSHEPESTVYRSPTREQFGKPVPGSLPTIIRAFKAAVSRRWHQTQKSSASPLWQRGYYEHVIRNDSDLQRIREYIANNPLRWELDRENPRRRGEDSFDRWLASFQNRPPKPPPYS